MESEIAFTIHWSWVIWPSAIIAAVAIVGGIGAYIGYQYGDSNGYTRGYDTTKVSLVKR